MEFFRPAQGMLQPAGNGRFLLAGKAAAAKRPGARCPAAAGGFFGDCRA